MEMQGSVLTISIVLYPGSPDEESVVGLIEKAIPNGRVASVNSRPRDQPIESLGLSERTYNCLKRAYVNTIDDLMDFTYSNLLEIRGFGAKASFELAEKLQSVYGLSLKNS